MFVACRVKLEEQAQLQETSACFVIDAVVKLVEEAGLESECRGLPVTEGYVEPVALEIRLAVGEEKLIAGADLIRLEALFLCPKRIGYAEAVAKAVAVALFGKAKFCPVTLLDPEPADAMVESNMWPYTQLVVVFGCHKISAFFIGVIIPNTQSCPQLGMQLIIEPSFVFVVMKVPVEQERAQLCLSKEAPFTVHAISDIQDIPTAQPIELSA